MSSGVGLSQLGGEPPVEMNPSRKFLVQNYTPLSESVLWDLLSNYYKKMSLEAWSDNYVPMFVTSNSRFAKAYAKVVFAFLKDWFKSPKANPTVPVYILEVGAGHGRFSYLFLRHLLKTRPLWKSCGIPDRPFIYVFSDVAAANVEFCSKHKALQEFIQDGWLDFALFDANLTNDWNKRIHLKLQDATIPYGSPMVVVCNYVLDSLLTDGYQITNENGVKHFARSRIAIYSTQEEPDPTDPDLISRMTVNWDWERFEFPPTSSPDKSCHNDVPFSLELPSSQITNPLGFMDPPTSEAEFFKGLAAERKQQLKKHVEVERRRSIDSSQWKEKEKPLALPPAYLAKSPRLQWVLQQYAEQAEDLPGYSSISFVLPFGAFMLFEYLNHYSNGNLLVLIGDKGYSDSDEFRGDRPPHIAIHGSISFMVNLHSIKQYFVAMGGFSTCTPYKDTFQVTFCYSFSSLTSSSFGESLSHLLEDLEDLAPDSLIAWQKSAQESSGSQNIPTMKTLISLLRYSCHDPEVFFNLRKEFAAQCAAPFLGPRGESDLQKDLERVYEHWYKLRKYEDVPDVLAQLSMKTGRLDRALYFFQKSIEWCPESRHVATLANMAACYKALGDLDNAFETITRALTESPAFRPALDLKTQIEMCRQRTSIALIGNGCYLKNDVIPLIIRDGRVVVKGIFAFHLNDATLLSNQLKLGDECVIYSGSSGLTELLSRSDIDACIVDVHADLFGSIALKIWKAGKHLLAKAPIALTSQGAHDTLQKFIEFNLSSATPNSIVWHVVASERQEEAFQEVSKQIENGELGAVQNVSYRFTSNDATETGYSDTSTLAIDLFHGLTALRIMLSSNVTSIGATKTKSSAVLAGWCKLSNCGNSKTTPGSFFCCRNTAGDKLCQFDILCEKGSIRLKRFNSSWKVTTKLSQTLSIPPREKAYTISGIPECHDAWFQQLFVRKASREAPVSVSEVSTCTASSEEEIGNSIKPNEKVSIKIHSSVHDCVIDSAVIEAVIVSVKNDGCAMELSTPKSDNTHQHHNNNSCTRSHHKQNLTKTNNQLGK